jgi:uncharacterized protein YdhG (YjbR/CyaY superfamily)
MSAKKGKEESNKGFTADERAAMKERAKELKAEERRSARTEKAREEGERDVLEKIAEMGEEEGAMAARLHEIITASAPTLMPKTWYGMPAYARGGKVVCHFQAASKFNTRYPTLGFSDEAKLDDGALWPVAFALKELTPAVEAQISALVKQAVAED